MKWVCSLISLVTALVLTACSTTPYRVCDGTNCRSMTKNEAIDAAEVSKEWGNKSTLTLGIQKEK